MAPTEASILSNFLLLPAPLPTIITLQKFTELVPKPHRSNPQVKLLYRELQHLRGLQTDEVKRNIAEEVKLGRKQQKEVVKVRRRAEKHELGGVDGKEIELEGQVRIHCGVYLATPKLRSSQLYGPTSNRPMTNPHTLTSILPEMSQACADIEEEIAATEAEADALLDEIKSTVGDLSDLRYGRLQRLGGSSKTTVEEAIEGLQRLEDICNGGGLG